MESRQDPAARTWEGWATFLAQVAFERNLLWLVATALVLALMALRGLAGFLHPPIMLEDGPYMLQYYAEHRDVGAVLRSYAGYISLGPNLIGYVAGATPLWMNVYLLHWMPMVLAALPCAAFCHRDVALPGMTPLSRLFLALVLALLPAGNFALVSNTTYSLWNMLLLLSAMVILWSPRTTLGLIAGGSFGIMAIWSHPACVVLVPFMIARLLMAKEGAVKAVFLAFLLAVPAYVAFAVDFEGSGQERSIPSILAQTARLFLERGIFETIAGTPLRMKMIYHDLELFMWLVAVSVLLGFCILLWRLRNDRAVVAPVVQFLVLGFLFCLFSSFVRGAPLETAWSHRYAYPASFMTVLGAVLLLANSGLILSGTLRKAAGATALVLLSSLWFQWPFYRTDPALGRQIRDVVALRDTDDPPCVFVERGDWSFSLPGRRIEGDCITPG